VSVVDEVAVAMLLSDVAGLQRFLQAREIDLNQRLRQLAAVTPGIDPEAINARSTGRSAGNAGRAVRRADEAAKAPELKACMDEGRLSGEHLDAFTAALRSLDARLQPTLRALEADLAARAVTQRATVEQFRTWLQREVRLIEADDGKQRLERQKRAARCRSWTDPNTGMVMNRFEIDPEHGAIFLQRLDDQLEARLRQPRPPECPTDPIDAMDWQRAHALMDLITGKASASGKPEVSVVIDQQTPATISIPAWIVGRGSTSRSTPSARSQAGRGSCPSSSTPTASSSPRATPCPATTRSPSRSPDPSCSTTDAADDTPAHDSAEPCVRCIEHARSPAVDGTSPPPKHTTSTGGTTAGTPTSTTSSHSADTTTTDSTTTGGNSHSHPTAASQSAHATAPPS
jgi:hypothetical protein